MSIHVIVAPIYIISIVFWNSMYSQSSIILPIDLLVIFISLFILIIILKLNTDFAGDIPPVALGCRANILDELERATVPQHNAQAVPSSLSAEQDTIILICTGRPIDGRVGLGLLRPEDLVCVLGIFFLVLFLLTCHVDLIATHGGTFGCVAVGLLLRLRRLCGGSLGFTVLVLFFFLFLLGFLLPSLARGKTERELQAGLFAFVRTGKCVVGTAPEATRKEVVAG